VKALEGGFDMFNIFATKGIDGIWEFLKDKFTDLTETVIDAIKDMLITQVIQTGIKWLLSLLIPGAGFIKAIMAIKDLIVFFVESAIMLILALTEAILALATGSVAGVAKAIEFGLAKLIGLVINLFAKLIGLGELSKKVQAIFKKIRKRVDKAVNKMLKKARKAGRKLMRKLGIGKKKDKQGKEERSKKEMEADLKQGIKEGTTYVKSAKGQDKKEIDKKLKKIADKYDLKKLTLIIDKHDENGKEQVHVHGEVNPEFDGEKFTVETDEKGKVELPPRGYAYFLREYNPRRHFRVILSSGAMIYLSSDRGIVEILFNDKTFQNAAKSRGKNPPKVVEIETPGKDKKENFIALKVDESKTSESKIMDVVRKYNGKTYGDGYDEDSKKLKEEKKPVDCFKFAVDLLNGMIENQNNLIKPEGEDNDKRFDNLLSESFGTIKRSKK
jgi:hypothetical protein